MVRDPDVFYVNVKIIKLYSQYRHICDRKAIVFGLTKAHGNLNN